MTAAAALSVAFAGCGSHQQSAQSARNAAPAPEPSADSTALVPATASRSDACSLRSGEAKVGAQVTERGAALVFTTSDDARILRERVAELTVQIPVRNVQPRFDNIRGGVRLVFDAETAGERAVVQRVVGERAREIAATCGMVLAGPGEWSAEQQREESPRPADSSVPSRPSETSPAQTDTRKESEADKSDRKDKADAKPEPAPDKQPKPENEPKASDKPKDDKPKEDEKPPIPSLPGPHPDPIAPDRKE
jgi:hypothetical protein